MPAILSTLVRSTSRSLLRGILPLLILGASVLRVNAEQSGDFVYFEYGGIAHISGYRGAGGAVVIPSVLNGTPVRVIYFNAFANITNVTSVIIPDGVTSIEPSAFGGCTGLTSVTIPNTVTQIRSSAFTGCSALKSVTIPSSVTTLEFSAFRASGLTSVTIPATITTMGEYVFQECANLASVTFPETMSAIPAGTFDHCPMLTSVTIPNSVTSIGSSAFSSCTGLTSVTIPSGVSTIQGSTFLYCSSLSSVTIPESVISINDYAFAYCTALKGVTLPSKIVSLGVQAFRQSGLITVRIPPAVTSIGTYAFGKCASLKRVDFIGNAPTLGIQVFSEVDASFKIYYSYYSNQTGFTTPTWNNYPVGNLNEFTYTTSPDGITITGYPSTAIGAVNIPDTLNSSPVIGIGLQAFQSCTGLVNVTIPSSVSSIGDQAFQGCSGLESVVVPTAVTSIRSGLFQDCSGLTSVTIPSGVTNISEYAFKGCSGLKSVNLPASVATIGDSAFQNCSGLTSLEIPAGITRIGIFSFAYCSGLKNLKIPSGVTEIGDNAFFGCNGLANVTIPNTVTSIGSQAFYDCSSLTSVTIPSSVTSIGDEAFASCTSLSVVDFLGDAPDMGVDVFNDTAVGFTVVRTNKATGFTVSPWTNFAVGVNNLPVANSRTASTVKNKSVAVVITGKDPDGSVVTYQIVTGPTKGILTGTPPKLTYKPNADVIGSDSFTFTVSDGKVTSAIATVSITIGSEPPLPWVVGEIGKGKLVGSTIYKAGIFTQGGSGLIGSTSDKLFLTYQTLSGDGEIVAKVSALENTGSASRVGVMIRETLATNSPQVFVGLADSDSFSLMRRLTKGGKTSSIEGGSASVPKTWLKLVRKGAEINAYKSTNGTKWTLVDSVDVTLAENCYIGLAVASGSDTKLNTSQFSNVKVKQ